MKNIETKDKLSLFVGVIAFVASCSLLLIGLTFRIIHPLWFSVPAIVSLICYEKHSYCIDKMVEISREIAEALLYDSEWHDRGVCYMDFDYEDYTFSIEYKLSYDEEYVYTGVEMMGDRERQLERSNIAIDIVNIESYIDDKEVSLYAIQLMKNYTISKKVVGR